MIKCSNLTKTYKREHVLNDVNLHIEKDRIYGLIGRNGAGKTTLLKLLVNHIFPSKGDVTYSDDSLDNGDVCFVSARDDAYYGHTAENLLYEASLCYPNWDGAYADRLVKKLNIPLKKTYQKLSDGMKGALSTIIGLASRASFTVFDEHYIAMDAVNRSIFYEELRDDYLNHPRCIIISTHFIDEVSGLFEDVILIHDGCIHLKDSLLNIQERSYSLMGNPDIIKKHVDTSSVLKENTTGSLSAVSIYGDITPDSLKALSREGVSVSALSLEDWFVHISQRLVSKGGDI